MINCIFTGARSISPNRNVEAILAWGCFCTDDVVGDGAGTGVGDSALLSDCITCRIRLFLAWCLGSGNRKFSWIA